MAARVSQATRGEAKRRRPRSRRWKIALVLTLVFVNVGIVAASLYTMNRLDEAAAMIPDLPEHMAKAVNRPSVIVSKDNKVLITLVAEYRQPVRMNQIPDHVQKAILAAEDKRFFDHQGVDYKGLVRAVATTTSGRRVEGGSTLTMQLAKRVFSGDAKTIERKIKDMALALQIERTLTKEQIFEFYANEVYFGSGAYGIGAAADVYFGKAIADLTIAEAATLARCVRRPSHENPYANPEAARFNRNLVLDTMLEEGWITASQHAEAVAEPMRLRKERVWVGASTKLAPYFVDYIFQELRAKVPTAELMKGGYRVETTLDYDLNQYTEASLREWIRRYRGSRVTTGAFVVLNKDGSILAMVGGPDYNQSQFNAVTMGRRQPGSAFKPFIYAAAFDKGILSPNGSVSNEPFMITDDRGKRRAIEGGGRGGSVSVRTALASSNNTAACWANRMVGYENAVEFAKTRFGFHSELPAVETLALGSGSVSLLEMAEGYSPFQLGGDRARPFGITRVVDPSGRTVYVGKPTIEPLSLSSTAAEGVDTCLRSVVTSGTGRAAGSVVNARGKTGTTSDNKDAWFCGYTDRLIGVGWVGNAYKTADGRTRYGAMSPGVMGGHIVAPLWARIIGYAQRRYPEQARAIRGGPVAAEQPAERPDVEEPGDARPADTPSRPAPDVRDDGPAVIDPGPPVEAPPPAGSTGGEFLAVEVCATSGQRATAYCPERVRKRFPQGEEPASRCQAHRPP